MRQVNNLNLGDPTFYVPNGKLIFCLVQMLENKIKDNGLCIRNPMFGWVLSGPVFSSGCNNVVSHMTTTLDCDSEKTSFEILENTKVLENKHLTLDERHCEEHFDSTTRRNEDGRFVVQRPFKERWSHCLGLSKVNAMRRFIRPEYTIHFAQQC